jgi:hypothetical protein
VLATFVVLLVCLHYVGAGGDIFTNPYDDELAYSALARQLTQAGTLIDPFSFRRASALGAQTAFHGILLSNASIWHLNLFDRGICIVLITLLIAGFRYGRARPPALFTTAGLLLVLLFFYIRRANLASAFSGVAFFFGVFRTVLEFPRSRPGYRGGLAISALLAAATCALRQNYIPIAVGMVGLPSLMPLLGKRSRGQRLAIFREACFVGVILLIALSPWMILGYRSFGSFLLPIQKGFLRPAFAQSPTVVGFKLATRVFKAFTDVERAHYVLLYYVLGLSLPETDERKPLKCFMGVGLVGFVLLADAFSLAHSGEVARYGFGFTGAISLGVILTAGVLMQRIATLHVKLVGFASLAVTLMQFDVYLSSQLVKESLSLFDEQRRRAPQSELTKPGAAAEYEPLQNAVPPGEKLVVMVDEPCFLDYGRNTIYSLDIVGAFAPPPGIPFFRGPEEFANYFTKQGIRYIAFVDPRSSRYLYRRDFWEERFFDVEEIWRLYTPYFLDIFDTVDELVRTRRVLYEQGGKFVLDLATVVGPKQRVEYLLSRSHVRRDDTIRFGVTVRPKGAANDADRIAAAGFDFVNIVVSATDETGIADTADIDGLVQGLQKRGLPHSFQIRAPSHARSNDVAKWTKELEARGWVDRPLVGARSERLLFVEPRDARPPLVRFDVPGYDVFGVSTWHRFDKLKLDALPRGPNEAPLPADPVQGGYEYLRRSGYVAQWSPTWVVPAVGGIASIVPGWKHPAAGDTLDPQVLEHRDGRTLVEQFEAALARRPRFVLFYSWNDDENGTSLGGTSTDGSFYLDLASALIKSTR